MNGNGLPGFYIVGCYTTDMKKDAEADYKAAVHDLLDDADADVKAWAKQVMHSDFRCLRMNDIDAYWENEVILANQDIKFKNSNSIKYQILGAIDFAQGPIRQSTSNPPAAPSDKRLNVGTGDKDGVFVEASLCHLERLSCRTQWLSLRHMPMQMKGPDQSEGNQLSPLSKEVQNTFLSRLLKPSKSTSLTVGEGSEQLVAIGQALTQKMAKMDLRILRLDKIKGLGVAECDFIMDCHKFVLNAKANLKKIRQLNNSEVPPSDLVINRLRKRRRFEEQGHCVASLTASMKIKTFEKYLAKMINDLILVKDTVFAKK
ncbi:hypothetical protein DM01DRAFT_1347749 [Hesseltinella vesiculosa]|uniref:Uncharacterized protein n=1 Tax=Hesseltinella vesiculosa TaxID=101127 RepID=A0A1X2GAL8_9FUNG|nr:hypothetical protein DM01DRAFT_1347749 [Hesseltinella vesiculosa]